METAPSPTAEKNPRWFHPAPGRLLIVLLVIEAVLLLSERWLSKGYAVLIAIAAVGVTMLLMLLWWLAALCFHWRFQFSLRSLLVLTVAAAIPFSWLAVEMKRAREQREAVAAIVRLGGGVLYDYNIVGDFMLQPLKKSPSPACLHNLVGDDFLGSVVTVVLWGHQVADAELAHLKVFRNLRFLSLSGTRVSDGGLEHLKSLTQLQWLSLDRTQVTDVGLKHLAALPRLESLNLKHTGVTEGGVMKLQQVLPNCRIQRR